MEVENVLKHQLGHFLGRGQFNQGYEVSHLGEPVYHNEDDRVPIGGWQTNDKVQGNVGPGDGGGLRTAAGVRQRLDERACAGCRQCRPVQSLWCPCPAWATRRVAGELLKYAGNLDEK